MHYLLTVTETEITNYYEERENWIIETKAAIRIKLDKKWKMIPDYGTRIKLFHARGGRLCVIYMNNRIVELC